MHKFITNKTKRKVLAPTQMLKIRGGNDPVEPEKIGSPPPDGSSK